jgi:osmotically-inducible protein OsmY
MEKFAKLAGLLLLAITLFTVNVRGQQSQTQSPQTSDQTQQSAQSAEQSSSDKDTKKSILDALNHSDDTAHRVKVDVGHDQIVLSGSLWSQSAKQQAERVATEHSGGRKVVNKIKVVTHPPAM